MGGTAINRAAENGNMELLQYFIDQGGKIGDVALIAAARVGNLDAVKLLVESGAEVDAQQRWGHTALLCLLQKMGIMMWSNT